VILLPAIDLLDGKAVRLAGGRREAATIYSEEPWSLAEGFARAGANWIHVVDLDGAFAGRPAQRELVARIIETARAHGSTVEVGGGVRDADAVEHLFELGAQRVVVGTLAVRAPDVVSRLCRAHPERIVIAIDARDGMVAVEGWQETSTVPAADLARRAEHWGAGALLYTDVARDGLQTGPAVEATAALQAEVSIPVIASGGIATLGDLDRLRDAGVRAAVVGRAIYEGNFTVEEALARC
jgi:phosphoribosylformimino-5-aminoimidazole carboxamide ribotide isomerase